MTSPEQLRKKQYEEKLRRVGDSLRSVRYMFRGVFGLPTKPLRETITQQIEQRRNQPLQPQQGTPQQPIIRERFQRPRFLDAFFQPQPQPPPPQPQLSPEEKMILAERARQLKEDAERRAMEEAEEREKEERRKSLERAKQRWSVQVS